MTTGRIKVMKAGNSASSLPEIGKINLKDFYPIKGYPNYFISKEGKVFGSYRNVFLKGDIIKGGYTRVQLSNREGQKRFMLHRLVAMVFIPNPDNHPEVNHIDGDKKNNSMSNLEWCTTQHNHTHP